MVFLPSKNTEWVTTEEEGRARKGEWGKTEGFLEEAVSKPIGRLAASLVPAIV